MPVTVDVYRVVVVAVVDVVAAVIAGGAICIVRRDVLAGSAIVVDYKCIEGSENSKVSSRTMILLVLKSADE